MCEKADAESCKLVFGFEGGGGVHFGHTFEDFGHKWDCLVIN